MELILLLLLGGLAAGVGVWAMSSDRKPGDAESDEGPGGPGTGPRSSPGLPEGEGEARGDAGAGQPIVLGRKSGVDELRAALGKAPASVEGRVVEPGQERETRKPKRSRKPLKVTFSAEEIISRASKYAHHRRALGSADALVDKQKGPEALEIYERTRKRVPDEDIRTRIDTNIEDIQRWLAGADDFEDEPIQFPEIVIPLTTQTIALERLNEGLKTISEGLVGQLGRALDAAAPGPTSAPSPSAPDGAPTVPGAPGGPAAPGTPAAGAPGQGAAPIMPQQYVVPAAGEVVSLRWADDVDTPAADAPPGFEFDADGNLITDGWTDADFKREWEKFKNLPLKDRRSGKDRRVSTDRRDLDPRRRDRRSGIERRKNDLFKEREEFLKKLRKHKARKKQLEAWEKTKKEDKKPKLTVPIEALLDREHPPEAEIEPPPPPEPEPEPEKPEPEKEEEKKEEPEKPELPATMDFARPDLEPVGLPSAEDPYISPQPMQAEATSEDSGAGGAPGMSDGVEAADEIPELGGDGDEGEEDKPPPQEIRGVLELRPPDEDDAPFLTLTYDFSKIPDSFKLSRDYHTMEYAYYKYKPMLIKAQEFTRRKMLKNALNYYRVIKSQNIPPEFKRMVNRNILDITEYLEKFLMRRG